MFIRVDLLELEVLMMVMNLLVWIDSDMFLSILIFGVLLLL